MRRATALAGLLRTLSASRSLPKCAAIPSAQQATSAASADSRAVGQGSVREISTSTAAASLHISDMPYCSQRQLIPLGNRIPTMAPDTWLAPDAVVIGDVDLFDRVSIWNGAVLRGDLNSIRINSFTSIGDRTVIHAARSSPTGLPASTTIGRHVVVGQGCLLRSCQVRHQAVIGDRCILLEGSIVEGSSALAPGSLLAPGRLVPHGQLWAGNPARYVRDLTTDEKDSIVDLAEAAFPLIDVRVDEVLPTSEAYREAELVRERLVTASPAWVALLSGWEDTPVTPDDL